jgi:hypothetical protein
MASTILGSIDPGDADTIPAIPHTLSSVCHREMGLCVADQPLALGLLRV